MQALQAKSAQVATTQRVRSAVPVVPRGAVSVRIVPFQVGT